jgi:hypothetical protein
MLATLNIADCTLEDEMIDGDLEFKFASGRSFSPLLIISLQQQQCSCQPSQVRLRWKKVAIKVASQSSTKAASESGAGS